MTDTAGDGTRDDDDRAIARALGADGNRADATDDGDVDRDAVAEYEAVLAHLPFEHVAPSAGAEERVVAAALARRPAAATALDGRRSARGRLLAAGAAAVAAAVLVVVLVVNRPSGTAGGARIEPAAATDSPARVLARPGTRRADLHTTSGLPAGRVALGADGQGYLYDLDLPSPGGGALWLWLDTASGPVSVGAMPGSPIIHFVVRSHVDAVDAVLVTTEPTGQLPKAPGKILATAQFGGD